MVAAVKKASSSSRLEPTTHSSLRGSTQVRTTESSPKKDLARATTSPYEVVSGFRRTRRVSSRVPSEKVNLHTRIVEQRFGCCFLD